MSIELLYFDGCPSWHQALDNLKLALQKEGMAAEIMLVRVSEGEAIAHNFIGSPSIRVSGEDLFPEPTSDYALSCRVYNSEEGLKGWPTVEMIRHRLRTAGHSGMLAV